MKRVFQVGFVLMLVMLAWSAPLLAAADSYRGFGSGPTERAAIQDAFRQILETAQGIDVESNSYLTNSTIDRDNIHSYTNGHIENYTILDSHFDGTAYTVEVQAEVALGEGPGQPQTAVGRSAMGVGDLVIGLDLTMGGRRPAGGGALRASGVEADMAGSLAAAGFSHISSVHDAGAGSFDYVIRGTLTAQDMPMNLSTRIPLYTNQAVLSVRVLRADSGESVLTGEYLGSGIDISRQSAEAAAKQAAGIKAAEAIVSALCHAAVSTQKSYTVTVSNIENFRQVTALKDYLSYACDAKHVNVKTFEENNAVLTLDFTGESDDLAAMLTQNPSYAASITKITASAIELTY